MDPYLLGREVKAGALRPASAQGRARSRGRRDSAIFVVARGIVGRVVGLVWDYRA
jgi:hypothetical protein